MYIITYVYNCIGIMYVLHIIYIYMYIHIHAL